MLKKSPNLRLHMLINTTAVDCPHELINTESRIKGVAGKILQN